MTLDYFRELLFDVLNESDELDPQDIQRNPEDTGYLLTVQDGTTFEIVCKTA